MSEQLKLTGTVLKIEAAQQVTEKLSKRNFIVTTGDKYPETVAFELINDRCDLADAFTEGQSVDVSFNVRGREYNGKYYTNLSAWKIEAAGGATAAPAQGNGFQSANKNPALKAQAQKGVVASDDDNDLPF